MPAEAILKAADQLNRALKPLTFAEPTTHVINPLAYARPMVEQFVERYAKRSCRVVMLGMNPGPWGMAQTGIPFGEVEAVRDWLKLDAPIKSPKGAHPKRPIEGLACTRSEVSGRRMWGLMKERFGKPAKFFKHHFVLNYCPLCFMEEGGRNRTPDKLPVAEREPLEKACDAHLKRVVAALDPEWVIGVGAFGEKCAQRVLGDSVRTGKILHPSPASPAANRGWAEAATKQMEAMGLW